MFITIFHAVSMLDGYRPFGSSNHAGWKTAYSYSVPEDQDLEVIWRENNVVDGNERPLDYEARSLSVGDVVRVARNDSLDARITFHLVESVGWRELTSEEVRVLRHNLQ